jgi:DNA transposition AAA+ family ATPase
MPIASTPPISLAENDVVRACATYPEDLIDGVKFVARYARERCQRDMKALAQRVNKLGFKTTDATTWSRILRGKLINEEGEAHVNLDRLRQMIERMRKDYAEAVAAGSAAFIETGTWEDVRNYIDGKAAPETVCKWGMVIGRTGSQKTQCAKHYARGKETVIFMDAPERPTLKRFFTTVSGHYGTSMYSCETVKRKSIAECVTPGTILIIDNAQRLHAEGKGWSQPIFNLLQKLQDEINFTIILICVPEFELTLRGKEAADYYEQFEGRVGGAREFLVLEDFTPREDLSAIALAYGLKDDAKTIDLMDGLARERGRIRVLFSVLQKAQRAAARAGEPMAYRHLEAAANPEGK